MNQKSPETKCATTVNGAKFKHISLTNTLEQHSRLAPEAKAERHTESASVGKICIIDLDANERRDFKLEISARVLQQQQQLSTFRRPKWASRANWIVHFFLVSHFRPNRGEEKRMENRSLSV